MYTVKGNSRVVLSFVMLLLGAAALTETVFAEATLPAGVSEEWWTAAQENIVAHEYDLSWHEQGLLPELGASWQAPNRAQDLRTLFTAQGPRVVRRTAAQPEWTWGMELVALNGEAAPAVRETNALGNRFEYRREGGVTEWYLNDARGLEQGFTLGTPPEGGNRIVLEVATRGNLRGGMMPGGEVAEFLTPGGVGVIHFGGLKAWDATGAELNSRMEMDERGVIRLTVDAQQAVYPVTVDPVATSASWTGESDQDSASFGYSVATAGDVNGDGYSDVIVGAPQYDGAQLDGGRAYVYFGSASGLAPAASWLADGDKSSAQFGGSVATAGDVNGDGYSDIVVGAHTYDVDGDAMGEGAAFVYYGGASGPSATAGWTDGGGMDNEAYGRSVATAGDVNGDGYSDVVIGATGYVNGQAAEGRASVYLGSGSGLSGTAAWTREGNSAGALFGSTVGTAGDVNGDGYGDLLVAAYMYSNGELNEGAVFVFHGSASGLPAGGPSWTLEGNYVGAQMGFSAGTAGDVNGDGYADVIASAPQYNLGFAGEGLVVAYYGSASGLPGTANFRIRGNAAGVALGTSVATVGDVNGDGYADVAVGVTNYTNGQSNEGAVMGWFGSATGLYTAATQPTPDTPANRDWVLELNQVDAAFGCAVATAGDVNGDGYADLIAGAANYDNGQTNEGRAAVFYGSASVPTVAATTFWRLDPTNEANANYGFSVASAGDVNGDGFGDVIVGAPYFDSSPVIADQGGVFLYFGSTTGLPLAVSWSRLGGLASAKFGYSVASVGDVNGDGYGDIAVGAPGYSNGQAGEGRVYVYNGSASGPAGASRTLEVDSAGAAFGTSVAWAGDVNGDGYSDMVVGAPSFTNDETNEGRVYVYHGGPSGIPGAEAWRKEGNAVGALLGGSVAGAGDVNGDGYDDIIVGATGISGGGAAYVYCGSSAGLAAGAAWTGGCGQAGANYGVSVAGAGDINGDGYSDVLVGANLYDNTLTDEGRAYAYYGSAAGPGASPWVNNGGIAGAYYGFSVAGAGDLNHDGYSEVLVGAPMATITQTNEGRILAFRGSSAGVGAIVINLRPNVASLQYGFSVCGCGDVNGDGYGEVMYGVPQFSAVAPAREGRALVYYGNCEVNNSVGLALKPRQTKTDGSLLGPEGKSDKMDAARVVMFGKSPFGRAKLALEVEAKPVGVAFNGAGIQRSSGWTDTLAAGTDVAETLSGLTKGIPYHWRARFVYHPATVPFQVRSRWLAPSWNAETENDFRTALPPSNPSNPGVGAATTTSITWTWNDNSSDETGFGVWVDPGASDPTAQRALAAANATSYVYGGLSVNAQYAFQVNAKGAAGDSDKTATITGWTLAEVAAAPVLSNPTGATLDMQLGAAGGNPAYTVYAVQVSPLVGGNSWVQADGSVGASPVYSTLATWATTTVTGLAEYTMYSLAVVAQNGGGVNSAAGVPATLRTLDVSGPSGSIAVNGGAAYTASPSVTMSLTYDDGTGSGVADMRFSDDNSNWSAWEPAGLTRAYVLPGSDGGKTVYVQFRDVAGNVSSGDISASILLDSAVPTGTISIDGGAACTASTTVALALSADDAPGSGVVEMQFSEDGLVWLPWEPFNAARLFLLSGPDGGKTVYVQYKDAAGNVSALVFAGISLDTAGPAVSVTIDGGVSFTAATTVSLAITADDGAGCGVAQMRFSDDGTNWSAWEPFAAARAYAIAPGDGLKQVYVEVQDAVGNLSAVPALGTITLDTTGPVATVDINGGASYTASATLSLVLTETDGAGSGTADMRFSEDGVDWSAWEPYAAGKTYAVAAGDGAKTVYVELRDALGNVSAAPAQDGIILDSAPPTGTLVIDAGAAYATATGVTLALTADDGTGSGVTDMRVSEDGTNWGAWETYNASKAFSLSGPDGSKTVFVELRDAAGNVSAPALQDSIVLDVNAPTGTVLVEGGAAYATSTTVALALAADDGTGSGVAEMRFSQDGTNWDAWQAYGSASTYALTGSDGPKTVYAEFRDAAGNVSAAPAQDDVVLDTQAPTGTLVIEGGATYAYITAVNLTLSGDDGTGSGVTDMRFSEDGVNWGSWEPFSVAKTYTLGGSDGLKTVYAELRDGAGNVTAPALTASITLDTEAPSGTVQINVGDAYTNSTSVALTLSATDAGSGVSDMRFSDDGVNWSAWESYAVSASYVLAGSDGSKTVYAEFMDVAGRISAAATASITLDREAPTATIVRADASPTISPVLHFTVTFSEPVTPVFGSSQVVVLGGLAAIPAVSGTDPYTVTVVVTAPNPDGAVNVDLAPGITDLAGNVLAVVPAAAYDLVYWPGFSSEPQGARKYAGDAQTFAVGVNAGSRTPSYQWKFSNGTVQNGPAADTWALGALTAAKAGTYWCEVTYGGLVFPSSHALLEVRNRISITQPPIGANIVAGTSYQFTVGAVGGYAPLSYQWKKDGVGIDGAEGATYTVAKAEISDSGLYSVEVRDANGDAIETDGVELTVEKGTPLAGPFGLGVALLALVAAGTRRLRKKSF